MNQLKTMLEGLLDDKSYIARKVALVTMMVKSDEQCKPLLKMEEYTEALLNYELALHALGGIRAGSPSIRRLIRNVHRTAGILAKVVLAYIEKNDLEVSLETPQVSVVKMYQSKLQLGVSKNE